MSPVVVSEEGVKLVPVQESPSADHADQDEEEKDVKDMHLHSEFSDRLGEKSSLHYIFQEAKELIQEDPEIEEVHLGLVDHCNPMENGISHQGNTFPPGEEMPFHESFGMRNDLIDDMMEDIASEMEDVEDGRITVHKGVEIDFSPAIGVNEDSGDNEAHPTRWAREVQDFLEGAEEQNGFDYTMGSVHHVWRDGEPLYVKQDKPFRDFDERERREIVDDYFHKLEAMIGTEIFDVAAHPSLIERSDVLMDAVVSTDTRKDIYEEARNEIESGSGSPSVDYELENFFQTVEEVLAENDYRVKDLDLGQEILEEAESSPSEEGILSHLGEEFASEYESLLEQEKQETMREYYKPIIEALKQSSTIPEINGKGLERQHPGSVFWEMIDEHRITYTSGTDGHRYGEFRSRRELFDRLDMEMSPSDPKEEGEPYDEAIEVEGGAIAGVAAVEPDEYAEAETRVAGAV